MQAQLETRTAEQDFSSVTLMNSSLYLTLTLSFRKWQDPWKIPVSLAQPLSTRANGLRRSPSMLRLWQRQPSTRHCGVARRMQVHQERVLHRVVAGGERKEDGVSLHLGLSLLRYPAFLCFQLYGRSRWDMIMNVSINQLVFWELFDTIM